MAPAPTRRKTELSVDEPAAPTRLRTELKMRERRKQTQRTTGQASIRVVGRAQHLGSRAGVKSQTKRFSWEVQEQYLAIPGSRSGVDESGCPWTPTWEAEVNISESLLEEYWSDTSSGYVFPETFPKVRTRFCRWCEKNVSGNVFSNTSPRTAATRHKRSF